MDAEKKKRTRRGNVRDYGRRTIETAIARPRRSVACNDPGFFPRSLWTFPLDGTCIAILFGQRTENSDRTSAYSRTHRRACRRPFGKFLVSSPTLHFYERYCFLSSKTHFYDQLSSWREISVGWHLPVRPTWREYFNRETNVDRRGSVWALSLEGKKRSGRNGAKDTN